MPDARFRDVRRLETVDSTNRYLLAEARAGAPEGVVAVADFQTAGRGRRGRGWTAPPGANLLVSVLLRPAVPTSDRHLAATVVALAARDAARVVCGVSLGVKWPNDLVTTDGGKVAGVLAETDVGTEAGDVRAAVVVGIGLNCNWPDDGAARRLEGDLAGAVSLRQLSGRPVDREALLDALLDALGSKVGALSGPGGRRALRAELRAACVTLGEAVRVDLVGRTIVGTATDLNDEGHLVVRTDHGEETVTTGDVVHLRPVGDGRLPGGANGGQG